MTTILSKTFRSPSLKLWSTSGFVEEMRFVAMKLHTKDQAPKEGGKEASEHPMRKVCPFFAGVLIASAHIRDVLANMSDTKDTFVDSLVPAQTYGMSSGSSSKKHNLRPQRKYACSGSRRDRAI